MKISKKKEQEFYYTVTIVKIRAELELEQKVKELNKATEEWELEDIAKASARINELVSMIRFASRILLAYEETKDENNNLNKSEFVYELDYLMKLAKKEDLLYKYINKEVSLYEVFVKAMGVFDL